MIHRASITISTDPQDKAGPPSVSVTVDGDYASGVAIVAIAKKTAAAYLAAQAKK